MTKLTKSEDEWRAVLSPEAFAVCRQQATEAPFSGQYNGSKDDGLYVCVCCDMELFSSEHKFDSRSGWPSFWRAVENGNVELRDLFAVDDCGRVINPMIVQGQIHGALAQGIGQALMEHSVYDPESGQPVTGSLMDYAAPRADDLPSFQDARLETPAPGNPLGVKGVGESGTIGAPPAVVNAIINALAPLGVGHIDMPLTPLTVWQAIQNAMAGPA